MQTIKQSILSIVIGLALVAGISFAEWKGATANPPRNNTSAPLNVLGDSSGGTQTIMDTKTLRMGNGTKTLGIDGAIWTNGLIQTGGGLYTKGGTNKDNFTSFFPNSNGKNYIRGTTIIADSDKNNFVGIGTDEPTAKLHIRAGNNNNDPYAFRMEQGALASGNVLTSDASGNAYWAPVPVSKTAGLTVKENAGTVSCGANGVTNTISLGRNHFCYMQAVDANYQGSGDTWRGVYPTDYPDSEGKRNWNVGITCYGDSGNITAICVNF